jgi:hypothetical protein
MARIREILLPWDSQPQESAEISPKWVERGLIFAHLGDGVFWTPATDFTNTATLVGGPKKQPYASGIATGFGTTYGTGTTDRIDPPSIYLGNTGVRSIIAFVYPKTTGGGGFGRVLAAAGSTGIDTVLGESSYPNGASHKLLYNHATTSITYSAGITGSITLNAWTCFGFVHDTSLPIATLPVCYENGIVNSSVSFNVTPTGSLNSGYYAPSIGNRPTDGIRGWDGLLGPLLIFQHPAQGLTATEQADLYANPWQILTPRSIWVPVSVAAGGITLAVQDAAHAHAAAALGLTTAQMLALADAIHAQAVDNLTLGVSGAVTLTVADAAHAHAAEAPTLTTAQVLSVANALHSHIVDQVTLSATNDVSLVINAASHGHLADGATLNTATWLAIANALQAQLADNVGLTGGVVVIGGGLLVVLRRRRAR